MRKQPTEFVLKGQRILTEDGVFQPGWLYVRDGRIVVVETGLSSPPSISRSIDVGTDMIVPGFIDVHIHGAYGFSVNEQLSELARVLPRAGVTAFLPTFATWWPMPDLLQQLRVASEIAALADSGAEVLGFHLEGPFLNPRRKGAQNPLYFERPSPSALAQALAAGASKIRMITIAPEQDEAYVVIREAAKQGIIVALGHSDANAKVTAEAVHAGAQHVTHLFNAMHPIHHRDPGLAVATLLNEELSAEIVADGIHVDPAMIQLAIRCKGLDSILIVSDAVPQAGLGDGEWIIGDRRRVSREGRCTLEDGTLAGSMRLLDSGVRTLVLQCGLTMHQASMLASRNPARLLGIDDRKGSLAEGMDADIAVLNDALEVVMTIATGELRWALSSACREGPSL